MKDASEMMRPPQGRQEVIHTASERAKRIKETISEEAVRALDGIKAAAKEQLEVQRKELSHSLGSVQRALRATSGRLDSSPLGPGVERLSDAVGTAQQFLQSHQIDDVGVALRRLSLRSPAVFYTGLFALGFAAGRFVTSTEQMMSDETDLDLALLNAPPEIEKPNPQGKAVQYNGSY